MSIRFEKFDQPYAMPSEDRGIRTFYVRVAMPGDGEVVRVLPEMTQAVAAALKTEMAQGHTPTRIVVVGADPILNAHRRSRAGKCGG